MKIINKKSTKKIFKIAFTAIALLAVNFSSVNYSYSVDNASAKANIFEPLVDELLKRGADTNFVYELLNQPECRFDERFVKINVTGYLKKADYTSHYNSASINKTRNFIENNRDILVKAEHEYQVPKEVIAAILWVETRHGNYLGNNNIATVFVSTAMANQPKFLKLNLDYLRETYDNESDEYKKLEDKVLARAKKKSEWAMSELLAIEKISKQAHFDIFKVRGSWAGAMGISQFLPSSYINWAVDGNEDGKVDLFDLEDAIFSVANYLKSNGWSNGKENKRKAVFHYNNSSDYVDAVLTLAAKV